MNETDKQSAIEILNKIMELELAGVVRYTHYSLMVFGTSVPATIRSNGS
jgi:bacterioferritin